MDIQIKELSTSALQRAVQEVRLYQRDLNDKLDRLVAELAGIGVAAAVAAVKVDTGALRSSITAERRGDGDYLVIAQSPYVAFVEFGTGVVGAASEYPGGAPEYWRYDERRHPEYHHADDPTYWDYYVDGVKYTTNGQPAGAFMAHASEEMRNRVLEVARTVFS